MPDFQVRRDDLRTCRVEPGDPTAGTPAAGEAQLRVERFGFTANNITYATFGEQMGYWKFFPAPDGWGRVPVWGFGVVTASAADGVAEGDRFYGYFPMSSLVTVRPELSGGGFTDAAEHRAALPPVYNAYLRADPAAGFAPEHDAANVLLRPLFMTAWLIADQLEAEGWHDAGAVVLSSASSRTAYATAFELAGRAEGPAVIGLTSERNRAFTEGLGYYDTVLTYDEVSDLPVEDGLVYVDMAGDPAVRRAVHEHGGDRLRASITVGATHWEETEGFGGGEPLPGPTPSFFFAPARVQQRNADWGAGVVQQRLAASWSSFLEAVLPALDVEEAAGPEAVERVFRAFVEGTADPRKGHVLSL